MKRVFLFIAFAFLLTSITGCWTVRYDTASDSSYYLHPSNPNFDYVNSLSPNTTTPVSPTVK